MTLRALRSFWQDRSGASALEFAIVAPVFLMIVFSTFEAGWMMTKAILLDRALDITVRSIRVQATGAPTTQEQMKKAVCKHTLIILDCENSILIEMTRVQTAADFPSKDATCVDRALAVQPVVSFDTGNRDFVMYVRACVIADPLVPGIGLALSMKTDSEGGYQLVSSSAFMNEP